MTAKTGLDLQENADINIDGDPLMMQSFEEMHDEALQMNYAPTRMAEDVARIDYQ